MRAETESKKIVDAKADAKLADVKKAANDAAEKAKNAKESLATALTEAKNAKSKATGEEVNTWETAINELTELARKKAQRTRRPQPAKTEAEAVGRATKVEDAKTAWKESAGLLKTAKEKLDTATLKKLASSGAPTLEPSKRLPTPPTTDTTSKDQDKKKTAGPSGFPSQRSTARNSAWKPRCTPRSK